MDDLPFCDTDRFITLYFSLRIREPLQHLRGRLLFRNEKDRAVALRKWWTKQSQVGTPLSKAVYLYSGFACTSD